MYYSLFIALLALGVGGALAQNSSDFLRCGNGDPPIEMLKVSKSMAKQKTIAADRELKVDVYFHVITTETNSDWITDQMITDQVRQRIRFGPIRGLPDSGAPKAQESDNHHIHSRCMLKTADKIPLACCLEPVLFSPWHFLQPDQLGLHGERRLGHGKPRLRDEIFAPKRHLRRPQPLFPNRHSQWRTWLLPVSRKFRRGRCRVRHGRVQRLG